MLCKMCKMDCVIIVMLWVVIGAPRSYPVVDLLVSLSRLPMPILQHVFSDTKNAYGGERNANQDHCCLSTWKRSYSKNFPGVILVEERLVIDVVQISVDATTKLFQESWLMN